MDVPGHIVYGRDVGQTTHFFHAHFSKNLRIPTQHKRNLKRTKKQMHKKITNSVNHSIASLDVPHFLLYFCETMASLRICGLASSLTA